MAAPTYQIKFSIRPDSKYHDQSRPGEMFIVYAWDYRDKYCIVGGPGERYRLRDVDLFVVEGDQSLCIARGGRKEVYRKTYCYDQVCEPGEYQTAEGSN